MKLKKTKKICVIGILLFGVVCYLMGNVIRIKIMDKGSQKINKNLSKISDNIIKDIEVIYDNEIYGLNTYKVEFDYHGKDKEQLMGQEYMVAWISLENGAKDENERFSIKVPIVRLNDDEYTLDSNWMKENRGKITGEIELFAQIVNKVENIFYKDFVGQDFDYNEELRLKNKLEILMGDKDIKEVSMESEIIDAPGKVNFIAQMYDKKDIGFSKVDIKINIQ